MSIPEVSPSNAASLESILKVIAENHKEISATLKATNIKIDKFVAELSDKIDKVNTDLNAKTVCVQEDVNFRFKTLENRLFVAENSLERSKKFGDLIVFGIPASKPDDLLLIFHRICEKIQFDSKGVFVKIFRIGKESSTGKPSAILIKMGDRSIARNFFGHYITCKPPLSTSDIGFSSSARIHINYSLTPHDQMIFKKCLELKARKLIFQVNTDDGIVYVKAVDSAKKTAVSSLTVLNELVAAVSNTAVAPTSVKRAASSPTFIQQQNKSAGSSGSSYGLTH